MKATTVRRLARELWTVEPVRAMALLLLLVAGGLLAGCVR